MKTSSVSSKSAFQSTLPLRGATDGLQIGSINGGISIHAPLTGSDSPPFASCCGCVHFNPRSPYGERRYAAKIVALRQISIHAPLTGSDRWPRCHDLYQSDFNPRSPYGERPAETKKTSKKPIFQSTLPLRGATRILPGANLCVLYFNPRSPYGERPRCWLLCVVSA